MYLVQISAVIINILSIIILLFGIFHNFEQPKEKAVYGYFIVASMIIYLIMLGLIGMYGLIVKHNLFYLILFICVVSPFIIGKLVKYETLKKYTIAQIMCYAISLITLLLNF